MTWKIIIILPAGLLFLVSMAGYAYVRIKLKPKYEEELDDYYYEFEEQCQSLADYNKWSNITLTGAAIGALLLFIAVYL
ncbi:MAG: hypothetical protein WCZ89_06855 [Phycisphaerae bacterium]